MERVSEVVVGHEGGELGEGDVDRFGFGDGGVLEGAEGFGGDAEVFEEHDERSFDDQVLVLSLKDRFSNIPVEVKFLRAIIHLGNVECDF